MPMIQDLFLHCEKLGGELNVEALDVLATSVAARTLNTIGRSVPASPCGHEACTANMYLAVAGLVLTLAQSAIVSQLMTINEQEVAEDGEGFPVIEKVLGLLPLITNRAHWRADDESSYALGDTLEALVKKIRADLDGGDLFDRFLAKQALKLEPR